MSNVEANPLSEKELEAIEKLSLVDVSRIEANILFHLLKAEKSLARDIEKAADLRQPEVSGGVKKLIGRGWVSHTIVKSKGKGRPQLMYSLAMPESDIMKAINKLFSEKIQSLEKDREELNNLLREA